MLDEGLLDHRLGIADFIAISCLIALTFFLTDALGLPRFIALAALLKVVGGDMGGNFRDYSHQHEVLVTVTYEFMVFVFALLAGVLAVSVVRSLVKSARISVVCLISAIMMLIYAAFSIVSQGSVPAFLPSYLNVAAALPGWFIGYFLRCGADARSDYSTRAIVMMMGLTAVISVAVGVVPNYFPVSVSEPVLTPLRPTLAPVFWTSSRPAYCPTRTLIVLRDRISPSSACMNPL